MSRSNENIDCKMCSNCISVSNATFDWTNKKVYFRQGDVWTKISFGDLNLMCNDITRPPGKYYECGDLIFSNKEYNGEN